MLRHRLLLLCTTSVIVACASDRPEPAAAERDTTVVAVPVTAHDSFFVALSALCGESFEGRVIEDSSLDSAFANSTLIMHVRECNDSVLRIPFHVGDNRSRTWVVSKTASGLRLKHDHRHEDGSEDSVTQYGGDTRDAGTAGVQEFPADSFTASLIPAATTNVWTMALQPSASFTYALRREGTDRRFRVEFDLSRTVTSPPAPWGAQ